MVQSALHHPLTDEILCCRPQSCRPQKIPRILATIRPWSGLSATIRVISSYFGTGQPRKTKVKSEISLVVFGEKGDPHSALIDGPTCDQIVAQVAHSGTKLLDAVQLTGIHPKPPIVYRDDIFPARKWATIHDDVTRQSVKFAQQISKLRLKKLDCSNTNKQV